MLTINDFHIEQFCQIESKENIFLHKDLPFNTHICRYIPLDYLIDLLATRRIYVSNRKYLNDKREQGIKENLRDMFPLSPVYRSKKRTQQEAARIYERHLAAYSLCVSCWTKHTEESIMLWNCYGQNTCRIYTKVANLIDAIKDTSHTILIAPIQYNNMKRTELIYDKVFQKYEAYHDEQEIRLCVLCDEHHISLEVTLDSFIEDIIICPFFSKSYQKFLKESIEKKYEFLRGKIRFSHLLEYR